MDLIAYDAQHVPPTGFGLTNMGATCYFNSLMQALLSCSSMNAIISRCDNLPLVHYRRFVIDALQCRDHAALANMVGNVWANFMHAVGPKPAFGHGQQCAHEALCHFIDTLCCAAPLSAQGMAVKQLFEHRICTEILCHVCGEWRTASRATDTMFYVSPANQQLQHDLTQQLLVSTSNIDADYVCPKCKSKAPKVKMDHLTMAPEIIVVVVKKYNNAMQALPNTIAFPPHIEFQRSATHNLYYSAVAQIEHVGDVGGGHYWAICRRRDGWWRLNDTLADRVAGFASTPNTYIVMYHYEGLTARTA